MKYAVDIALDTMTYISGSVKTGSGIQKVMAEGSYTDTLTSPWAHKPTPLSSKSGKVKSN
jgi:hypothetical protein